MLKRISPRTETPRLLRVSNFKDSDKVFNPKKKEIPSTLMKVSPDNHRNSSRVENSNSTNQIPATQATNAENNTNGNRLMVSKLFETII